MTWLDIIEKLTTLTAAVAALIAAVKAWKAKNDTEAIRNSLKVDVKVGAQQSIVVTNNILVPAGTVPTVGEGKEVTLIDEPEAERAEPAAGAEE